MQDSDATEPISQVLTDSTLYTETMEPGSSGAAVEEEKEVASVEPGETVIGEADREEVKSESDVGIVDPMKGPHYYTDKTIELSSEHVTLLAELRDYVGQVLDGSIAWYYSLDDSRLFPDDSSSMIELDSRRVSEISEYSGRPWFRYRVLRELVLSKGDSTSTISDDSSSTSATHNALSYLTPLTKADLKSHPELTSAHIGQYKAPPAFYEYLRNEFYQSKHALIRHLTGSDYRLAVCKEAILKVVAWRVLNDVDSLIPRPFEKSLDLGWICNYGTVDKTGHCLAYFTIGSSALSDYWQLLPAVCYIVEKGIKISQAKGGKEQVTWIVDVEQLGWSTCPKMEVLREISKVLTFYYPERLFKCFIVFPPWIFEKLWGLSQSMLTENTKAKIMVVKKADSSKYSSFAEYIDQDQLLKKYGGTFEGTFSFDWEKKSFENGWGIKTSESSEASGGGE